MLNKRCGISFASGTMSAPNVYALVASIVIVVTTCFTAAILYPRPHVAWVHRTKFDDYSECRCGIMMANSSSDCGFLAARSDLVHGSPYLRSPPCLLMNDWIIKENPKFSIILTVYNQESVVGNTVKHIFELTTESFELVVVFDACTDNSIHSITSSISDKALPQNLNHVMLIRQDTPVFETTANNIGMRASCGKYWVLVQDDMDIVYKGWNSAAASPLRIYSDVFAVSMRDAHMMYSENTEPISGIVGMSSEHDECTLYVRDTVNRGPLVLRGSMVSRLGYLDEKNFYLGNDDHDLMMRAYVNYGWVCGFFHVPNDISVTEGNTRKKHVISTEEDEYIQSRKDSSESFLAKSPKVRIHNHDRVIPPPYGCGTSDSWFLKDELKGLDMTC